MHSFISVATCHFVRCRGLIALLVLQLSPNAPSAVQQWLEEHKSSGWDKYARKFLEQLLDGHALLYGMESPWQFSVGILARGVVA